MSRILTSASIVALTIVAIGCAPKGAYQKAEVTTRSLSSTRAELVATRQQIDASVRALNDLVNNPKSDMKKQYATFASAVDELNKRYERSRDRATDVRVQREAYMAEWKSDSRDLQSDELRQRAEERRGVARENFDRLRDRLDDMNNKVQPFVSDINDLRRYLGNDLTPAGVRSVRDLVSETRTGAEDAMGAVDEAVAAIDGVNRELRPSATKPSR